VAIDNLAEPVEPVWTAVAGGVVAGGRVVVGSAAEGGIAADDRAVVEQLAIAMTTTTVRPAVSDRLTEASMGGTS
jgi:hypothetical protein